jgi:hypothetical protein
VDGEVRVTNRVIKTHSCSGLNGGRRGWRDEIHERVIKTRSWVGKAGIVGVVGGRGRMSHEDSKRFVRGWKGGRRGWRSQESHERVITTRSRVGMVGVVDREVRLDFFDACS